MSDGQRVTFTRYGSIPEPREYGAKVEYRGDPDGFLDSFASLKQARDEALDYMMQKSMHSFCHKDEESPTCYFCSWAYKFSRFFYEAWWWQTLCYGCDDFMYRCGYSCELWEDY